MWLRSDLLNEIGFVQHGFTTKEGGVSSGPYASWNFSPSTGDSPETVTQNFQLLAERLHVSPSQIHSVHQIHSDDVILVEPTSTKPSNCKADALLSFQPGAVVGIKTADCVPVLMADPHSGAVASIHAGWRGVVGQIVPNTLRLLREKFPDAQPRFAIGPHICPRCFQVGPEVAAEFPLNHLPDPSTKGRFLVDMGAALIAQLNSHDIPSEHIELLKACTVCDPQQRFFSHRASKGLCGRLFNFIQTPTPS